MSLSEPALPPTMAQEFILPGERGSRSSDTLHRRPQSQSGESARSILKPSSLRRSMGLEKMARRTLGIILLLITVFLWTLSNFLASSIFADNTYSKPYFVTYTNTAFFAVSLLPIFLRIAHQHGWRNVKRSTAALWKRSTAHKVDISEDTADPSTSSNTRLLDEHEAVNVTEDLTIDDGNNEPEGVLSVRETAWLSLEFCLIWFVANYAVAACLEYTTVASSTILTSTSSIWTLLFGALVGVESFTWRKLVGVLASLTGIILISTVDLSGKSDENRGSFPHKTPHQIAIGDAMAIFSAAMYGVYTIVMKKRVGNEERVNMPLFFGLVGFFNMLLLWPGFLVLHYAGIEEFALPPTGRIWIIVLANGISSLVSDFCWAYAMLLTTPLVVTVGISLTIPLSLVGQMILSQQYSSALYWVGACIVLLSFLFINHESPEEPLPGEHHVEPVPETA